MDFLASMHGVGSERKAQTIAPPPKKKKTHVKFYRPVGVFLRRLSREFFRT